MLIILSVVGIMYFDAWYAQFPFVIALSALSTVNGYNTFLARGPEVNNIQMIRRMKGGDWVGFRSHPSQKEATWMPATQFALLRDSYSSADQDLTMVETESYPTK